MNFYTVILRKSADYWVSLCLENGLVGQGETQEKAIEKLKEAIESFGRFIMIKPISIPVLFL
jgi:predicted RNase H-like HicB family nuclease